jgi:hypothetical protein
MAYSAQSFAKRCQDAAEHFLQTVVVIDNEARFDDGYDSETPRIALRARTTVLTADIEGPGVALGESLADTQAQTAAQTAEVDGLTLVSETPAKPVLSSGRGELTATSPVDASSHELNAKALTDAFGDRSVLCTVYKPGPGEQMVERAAKIASHADIVVVDWYLETGSSVMAKRIVADILSKDAQRNGRLRLIVVYTAQPDMAGLAQELREYLAGASLPFDQENSVLTAPGVRIVFVQKAGGGTQRPPGSLAAQELPPRLIQEFATLSDGILPMVALQSIATIREWSHHIIATFHSDLDAAFVLHRCLLPSPDDAENFVVSLISAELASLLGSNDVGRYAGIDVKKDWVAARQPKAEGFPVGAEFVSVANLHARLEQGKEAKSPLPQQTNKKNSDILAEALYGSAKKARDRCLEFARISCLKREAYSNRSITPPRPPMLCLGTIVRPLPNASNEYARRLGPEVFLLCTQPACDSVRIKGERPYPFQRLEKAEDSFNIAVMLRDKTNSTLRMRGFPHLIEMFTFRSASAEQDFVLAQAEKDCFVFTDVDGNQFEWLADLNDFTAQWAMAQLGARVNTPGLDPFEWLRLKGERNKK